MLNFNTSPYYDNFDPSKREYRILFRPGFAVQARELTQMQTLLQEQIRRFGSHIFQDGSVVSEGQFTSVECHYVRVNPTIEVTDIGSDNWGPVASGQDTLTALSNVIDQEFVAGSSIRGRIITSDAASLSTDNFHAVAFNYLTDNRATQLTGSLTLTVEVPSIGLKYRLTARSGSGTDVTGKAFVVTNQSGVFYIDGFFTLASPQRVLLYTTVAGVRQFETPTKRVGFTVTDDIVTINDDQSLGDPAFGSPNQNAPGADRLRKTLTLAQKEFTGSNNIGGTNSPDFIEVLRYENGVVTKRNEFPAYTVLGETLARRTFDESGNYTVDPFDIQVREHTDVFSSSNGVESQLAIGLEPGKAYIRGYEFENIATQFISIDKARDFDLALGQETDFNMGRYVIIGATTGIDNGITGGSSVLNTVNHPLVQLQTTAGVTVATARFRQISFNAADQFRLYLYDVNNVSGQTFGDAAWVVGSGGTIGWISETAGQVSGQTILFNSTRDSLVVPLPIGEATKTVRGLDHELQISLSATGVGSTVTFAIPGVTGDPVEFKGNTGVIDPSLLGRDYFLINASTGDFYDDFSGITASLNNSTEAEFEFSASIANDEFVLIANARVDSNASTAPYFAEKTLGVSSAILSITSDPELGASVATFNAPDVYSVQRILGGGTGEDLSDGFILDDGQRDNFYDHSRLILKPGYDLGGETQVSVDFLVFTRSGNGPFTVDSYPVGTQVQGITFGYENIPSFTSEKTGKTYSLRDVIDFRPQRQAGGSDYTGEIPNAATAIEADYEHYLPRIDKVVLGSDQRFRVVEGVPSVDPQIPNETPGDMVLYVLRLGSYTFGVDDVEVRYVDNKRFTMRDLGRLEDRVDQLEFFSSLSFLEQEANGRIFTDSNGDIIPKTGILVDNFNGHQIGNVTNPDYLCAMDFERGELRPAFKSQNIQLVKSNTTDSTVVGITVSAETIDVGSPDPKNQIYMLSHTSQRALGNNAYNTTVNINPTSRVDWLGHMYISPESDNWYSKDLRPDVKVNKQGANDAYLFRRGTGDGKFGFDTQWLDWEVNWFGNQRLNKEINRESELLRTRRVFDEDFTPEGINANIRDVDTDSVTIQDLAGLSVSSRGRGSISRKSIPDSILKTVADRIVNTSIQPYSQSKTIRVKAVAMKPNTNVWLFVDNEPVSDHETSSDGSVEIEFSLPSVRTGPRVVRLIDSPTNNINEATTVSETIFRASGLFETNTVGAKSTRSPVARRASVRDDTVLTDVLTRNNVGSASPRSITSLAQSFTVDPVRYQNGMFLKSVDLWFQSVPSEEESQIPVVVEIRPMQNGFPHPSRVVPGSVVLKKASEITDTAGSTNFAFEYPVYLEPGDYAITIRSNSGNYNLRAGAIGSPADNSSSSTNPENTSPQPFVGPLFRPQNAGSVSADETTAIAFAVNRCKFDTNGGTLVFNNDPGEDDFSYDLFRINVNYLDPSQNSLSWSIRTSNDGGSSLNPSRRVVPNETLEPPSSLGRQNTLGSNTLQINIAMSTTDDAISPVVDGERLSFLAVQNDIRTTSSTNVAANGELFPQISDSSAPDADVSKSRYITKTIVLEDGMDSTDIRVFASVSQPGSSLVQVFAKTLPVDSSQDFDERNWVQLDAQTVFNSLNRNDFREVEYKPSVTNKPLLGSFRVFAIKVVMHATNGQDIPRIRDLRAISLA